ncbi:MAG: hypothetical protein KAH01_04475, partial [Caldisericia bacterium]|nr:hypothetical protein [Caldisericia bacterium]
MKNGKKISYGVQKLANTALREKGSSQTDKDLASFILAKITFDAETNEKMWNVAQHVLNNPKRRTVATKRMAGYVL